MMRLREACRPFLSRLAQETGDTAFLVLRSGADAVCVDRVEGSFPIRALTLDVGSCRPLGVGAAGLAILSSLGADERAAVYAQRREAVYGFERLAVGELERLAGAAHQRGYAVSSGVVLPGVIGVGRVLRLPGTALAALSVAAISQRLDAARVEAVATLLAREVAGIERHFGVARPEGRAA
jgi:DNA-binding IclR family transcriptional regulator